MEVKDVLSVDGDVEPTPVDEWVSKNFSANPAIKAAFEISKQERKEIADVRVRMMKLQRYMVAKGLSMAEFERARTHSDGMFNAGLVNPMAFVKGRDEFGLPILGGEGVNKVEGVSGLKDQNGCEKVFDNLPHPGHEDAGLHNVEKDNGGKCDSAKGVECDNSIPKPHSWSQVVKNGPPKLML